ncbi:MAG: hypothetical protein J5996_06790 [Prevotella sp.]|nr:hypothetical protein [Prevotella sp.]
MNYPAKRERNSRGKILLRLDASSVIPKSVIGFQFIAASPVSGWGKERKKVTVRIAAGDY